MHAILEKVSTVPCAEDVTGFQTKCVLGFFTEPGGSAIKSVGKSIQKDTVLYVKDASEVYCSGTLLYCHFGVKYLFDLLKLEAVPNMVVEGVRMPVGYNWCDSHACRFSPSVNSPPRHIKTLPLSGVAIQH